MNKQSTIMGKIRCALGLLLGNMVASALFGIGMLMISIFVVWINGGELSNDVSGYWEVFSLYFYGALIVGQCLLIPSFLRVWKGYAGKPLGRFTSRNMYKNNKRGG